MAGLKVNSELCSGCRICELVCSFWHEGLFNPQKARIRIRLNRSVNLDTRADQIDMPQVCEQCVPAPCEQVCPVEAIAQNQLTRAWEIDADTCVSCDACAEACPYGVILIDADADLVAKKCDLCQGTPQCVLACPRDALTT